MRGLFITFEGGEGSGKTTQIGRLADFLRGIGREVITTREPGGSPGAEALRQILLTGAAKPFGPEVEAILFAAARADHVSAVIGPSLACGRDVLCDRFYDSTRVYQGSAVDPLFLELLEEAAVQGAYPDLTFILDLPAEEGLRRAAARRDGQDADRFEVEPVEIHEARRQTFLRIAETEPRRCRVLDASLPVEEVAAEIRMIVSGRLDELEARESPDPGTARTSVLQ